MERTLATELSAHVGQRVRMAGWLHHPRQLAQVAFLLLRDRSGVAQVVLTGRSSRDAIAELLAETVVEVEGSVVANEQAPGGVELVDATVEVLTEGTRLSAGVPTRSGRHRTDAGQGAGRLTESTRTQSIAVVEGWPYVVSCRSGEEPRMPVVSRGFRGRRRQPGAGLVPPGQYLVDDFPVLSAGPTPDVALKDWDLTVVDESGAVLARWDWGEFRGLPAEEVTVDIHCVTKWSKLGTRWQGVSVDTILGGIDTAAEFVVAFSDGGYTTNLPLADVLEGQAWVAYRFQDEDLEPEHGGPARLLVPHLYFWKSAKWVRGLRLTSEDEPGFWESVGYHNYGDPWREQRYWGD